MHKRYFGLCWILLTGLPSAAVSQVTVTGPTCAIPGTIYQYLINGPWDSTATLQVCLTGGVTADSNQTCTSNGGPRTFVLVTWNRAGSVIVQINSSKGNTTLNVTVTDTLSGGAIDPAVKSQLIPYDSVSASVTCGPASGGNCTPTYSYRWQQSMDMLSWQNIDSATGQSLSLSQPLQQSIFVRRQVTETSSGTIAYSDVAVINVGPPPPPGTSRIPVQIVPAMEIAFVRNTPLNLF